MHKFRDCQDGRQLRRRSCDRPPPSPPQAGGEWRTLKAPNGKRYTLSEFKEWYGERYGLLRWHAADRERIRHNRTKYGWTAPASSSDDPFKTTPSEETTKAPSPPTKHGSTSPTSSSSSNSDQILVDFGNIDLKFQSFYDLPKRADNTHAQSSGSDGHTTRWLGVLNAPPLHHKNEGDGTPDKKEGDAQPSDAGQAQE